MSTDLYRKKNRYPFIILLENGTRGTIYLNHVNLELNQLHFISFQWTDGAEIHKHNNGRISQWLFLGNTTCFWLWVEFFEYMYIDIFSHFMAFDNITCYSYHMLISSISTSLYCRFRTWCIVSNGEWQIFVDNSILTGLLSMKLCVFILRYLD